MISYINKKVTNFRCLIITNDVIKTFNGIFQSKFKIAKKKKTNCKLIINCALVYAKI